MGSEDNLDAYRKEGLKLFQPGLDPEELIKDPNKMDPEALITVRTVDHKGRPVPYCRVVFVDRDEKTTRSFHETATNTEGYTYCDVIASTFSIMANSYEYDSKTKIYRSQHKKIAELYNVQNNKLITVKWDPFPTGSGKIEGRVLDQYNKPLTKFKIRLSYLQGVRTDWSESYSTYQSIEVDNPQGHYELEGLAPRTYSYMIRAEDYAAYTWDFDMGRFTIPEEPNAVVRLDIKVEAKELRYGQAFYYDGMPVYPGSFQLWFEKYSPEKRLEYHVPGEGYRNRIHPNGLFRVPLSQQERKKFMKTSRGYVIIDDREAKEIGQVHISKLSKNPSDAPKLLFPRKSPRASLVSSLLPDLETIKIKFNPNHAINKMMLVCFFDINQRPSRNCLRQLSTRAQELKAEDVVVVAIQVSKVDENALDEWVKENSISFPIGMVAGDGEETRFSWGVKSLPWLILTDKKHVVTADGFGLGELDERIKQ